MAKWNFHATNWTPTAVGDGADIADASFMAVQGGSATQMIDILEIMINGLASSTTPTLMQFARDSTVAGTPTALAAPNGAGPMHPSSAALAAPPVTCVASGTQPQRSNSTSHGRLELGLNAFGGIVRWVASPTAQWGIITATQPLGESSLSAFTGGTPGAISAHIIYEPY
jgi:hypothetical protein